MNNKQIRQALWALAAALVTFVAVRRWRTLIPAPNNSGTMPGSDNIPLPLPAVDEAVVVDEVEIDSVEIVALPDVPPIDDSDDDEHDDEWEAQMRKVSRDRRIKYHGQRYGPLPETLVGERVHVDVADGTLHASYDGQVVASFLLHTPNER